MLAVLGGLGAALAFTGATLCNSRAARLIGPWPLLAWVMAVGLVIVGPLAAIDGVPDGLDGDAAAWLTVAAVGNIGGLALAYTALRIGLVGLVAPIVSTQGAIAAVIAIATGEDVTAIAAALLCVVALGVWLAGRTPTEARDSEYDPRAVPLAMGAAAAFGASLYATGRVGEELPVAWALLPARVLGVAALTLPFLAAGKLRMTRRALALVLVSGTCEVAGFAFFVFGARHGIAITAVLASQFAALSAVAAWLLFRERLAPGQIRGVATIVAGVACLSVVQA